MTDQDRDRVIVLPVELLSAPPPVPSVVVQCYACGAECVMAEHNIGRGDTICIRCADAIGGLSTSIVEPQDRNALRRLGFSDDVIEAIARATAASAGTWNPKERP